MEDAELQTARLVLRPLRAADADELHALWTAPGVRRYLWDDQVIPRERTTAVITESERLFTAEGYGLWGARDRASGELVGFGGFWYFHEPPRLELLYGVAESHWTQGLATELATTVMRFGRDRCGFQEILASTDAPNAASVRVLEKLGFEMERQATVAGLDTLFFRLRIPPSPASS